MRILSNLNSQLPLTLLTNSLSTKTYTTQLYVFMQRCFSQICVCEEKIYVCIYQILLYTLASKFVQVLSPYIGGFIHKLILTLLRKRLYLSPVRHEQEVQVFLHLISFLFPTCPFKQKAHSQAESHHINKIERAQSKRTENSSKAQLVLTFFLEL